MQVRNGVSGQFPDLSPGRCWRCGLSAVITIHLNERRCLMCARQPGGQATEHLRDEWQWQHPVSVSDEVVALLRAERLGGGPRLPMNGNFKEKRIQS